MDRLVDPFFGIDTELLHQADQALARQGVSLREAIVAYLEQIVETQGAPPAVLDACGAKPAIPEMDTEAFEEAVADVARGSVYTSHEIKAYLQQMEDHS